MDASEFLDRAVELQISKMVKSKRAERLRQLAGAKPKPEESEPEEDDSFLEEQGSEESE